MDTTINARPALRSTKEWRCAHSLLNFSQQKESSILQLSHPQYSLTERIFIQRCISTLQIDVFSLFSISTWLPSPRQQSPDRICAASFSDKKAPAQLHPRNIFLIHRLPATVLVQAAPQPARGLNQVRITRLLGSMEEVAAGRERPVRLVRRLGEEEEDGSGGSPARFCGD